MKIIRYILRLVFASIAVYIGVMPLIAYYFNIISPITILANILIIPLLGVVLFLGILLVILGGLSSTLALFLGPFLHIIFLIFTEIVTFFSKLEFGHFYIPDIPLYIVGSYYILILAGLNLKRLKLKPVKIFIAALLVLNIFIWQGFSGENRKLRITFLNVKAADTIFLEFPDGKTMLINCGEHIGYYYNEADSIVVPFLWRRRIKDIDVLFLRYSKPSYETAVSRLLKKQRVRRIVGNTPAIKNGMEVEGFGDIKLFIEGSSTVKLIYRDIKLLLLPKESYLYKKERLEMASRKGLTPNDKSGAITIITDGFSYLIEEFLNPTSCD